MRSSASFFEIHIMKLIQIYLPVPGENDAAASGMFEVVQKDLALKFGGVTAFVRAPGKGQWRPTSEKTVYDDLVIVEVITEFINKEWWTEYRKKLASIVHQDKILITVNDIDLL